MDMGPMKYVLDGGPEMLRDVAMATIFWLPMGYNFGCMIASDKLFDSRGGLFGIKLSDENYRDRVSKARCYGNKFRD